MSNNSGAHDSKELPSGETVHLIKPPQGKWRIKSYDWSWVEGRVFKTAQVYAQNLGWENIDFDKIEDAYSYVSQEIGNRNVPCKAHS